MGRKYFKEWLFDQRPLFKKLSVPIDSVLNSLDYFFNLVPLPIVILFFAYFAFKTNGIKFAIFTFCSLIFIDLVDVWEETMTTMAMIITAVLFCSVIGIPIGIAASRSNLFEKILRPILDVMQTIPSFVYLIPVVMLFGIGITPGVIAIIIFSIAPVIRLTNLGLRQVEKRFKDAARALGCNKWLVFIKLNYRLALKNYYGRGESNPYVIFIYGSDCSFDWSRWFRSYGLCRLRKTRYWSGSRWWNRNCFDCYYL